MVVSKIDESIVYPDIRSIDTSDVGYDANLYEMELLPSINGIIALGNVKYKFSEKNGSEGLNSSHNVLDHKSMSVVVVH